MPPATTPGGMSPSTTLPAVITEPAPMVEPGSTVTRLASHAPSPITTGATVARSGWSTLPVSASEMMQCGPKSTLRPTVIDSTAWNEVP